MTRLQSPLCRRFHGIPGRVALLVFGPVVFGLAVSVATAAPAGTPQQAEAQKRFLDKYPQADADGDGVLLPSEVWVFRLTKGPKKGGSPSVGRDVDAFLRATYTPPAIDDQNRPLVSM